MNFTTKCWRRPRCQTVVPERGLIVSIHRMVWARLIHPCTQSSPISSLAVHRSRQETKSTAVMHREQKRPIGDMNRTLLNGARKRLRLKAGQWSAISNGPVRFWILEAFFLQLPRRDGLSGGGAPLAGERRLGASILHPCFVARLPLIGLPVLL